MCFVCDRISQIKSGRNKHFVAELETGYVVMADHQFFRGYTLFICKKCVPSLYSLDFDFADLYLKEMRKVATHMWVAFSPKTINIELLGNKYPHLHWHLIPRYKEDPLPESPIWEIDKSIWRSDKCKLNKYQLLKMKNDFLETFGPTKSTFRKKSLL
jgi:diadenosine tetraphosphate (Ap4A) HIT family hydrolase